MFQKHKSEISVDSIRHDRGRLFVEYCRRYVWGEKKTKNMKKIEDPLEK